MTTAANVSARETQSTNPSGRINKRKLTDWGWGYLMVAPTIIGLIVLNIWPIIQTIAYSFCRVVDFDPPKFVGLQNWAHLFQDAQVGQATINTVIYAVVTVAVGVFLSLVVAILLNTKIKGRSVYRTLFFLPVVSTPAAIAMVWRWLLNNDYGIVNYVLSLVGIKGPNWLGDGNFVLISVMVVGIWSMVGYNMIIFLSGLQEIPETFYEAADMDGAGTLRKFWHITVPLISPTMFFVMITTIISSLQVFDIIFMMVDKGNPALPQVMPLVYLFYKYTFIQYNKGYGSTIAVFLFLITMLATAVQLILQKKWVHYDD